MSKLSKLYKLFIKEREAEMSEELSGADIRKNLNGYLKSKLNADDYFHAEELINEFEYSVEERGFKEGAKYTFGLGLELSGQEEKE